MKISHDLRTQLDPGTKNQPQPSVSGKDFGKTVNSQTRKLQQEELQRLMKNLNAQGERLAQSHSFRDLARYKKMVKDFVKEAVQYGMDLKHSHSFNFEGRGRNLIIVEEVDEKLMELTEAMMASERKPIDLLGLIGEVKGLLINLYT